MFIFCRTAEMPALKNAIEYNMNHKKRGLALMFNHENFKNAEKLPKRFGAEKDLEAVNVAFGGLGFEVISYCDSTVREIMERTQEGKYIHIYLTYILLTYSLIII